MKCVHCLLTRQRRIQWINTCTLVATATASTGGGGEETEKTQFPFSVASAFQNGNTTWEVWSFPYMYTGSSSYSLDCGGGGEGTEKTQFPFSVASAFQNGNATWKDVGSFPLFPPSPTEKIIISPPRALADMLSWAISFKFLLNKVIANTCLFILTSFSKQSASRKVLDICELCALSTDSRKTYLVNNYMYTGRGSYGFDWGGGRNGKDPISFFCCISLPKWKRYMKRCWVFSVISSQPHWQNYYFPPSWYAQLSRMVQVSA